MFLIIDTFLSNNVSCYLKCAFESQVRTPKHVNTIYISNIYINIRSSVQHLRFHIFCYHRFSFSFRFMSCRHQCYVNDAKGFDAKYLIFNNCTIITFRVFTLLQYLTKRELMYVRVHYVWLTHFIVCTVTIYLVLFFHVAI